MSELPNKGPVLWISIAIIACAAALTGWLVVTRTLSQQAEGIVLGAWLTGGLMTVVNFWLGSSAGRGRQRDPGEK